MEIMHEQAGIKPRPMAGINLAKRAGVHTLCQVDIKKVRLAELEGVAKVDTCNFFSSLPSFFCEKGLHMLYRHFAL